MIQIIKKLCFTIKLFNKKDINYVVYNMYVYDKYS